MQDEKDAGSNDTDFEKAAKMLQICPKCGSSDFRDLLIDGEPRCNPCTITEIMQKMHDDFKRMQDAMQKKWFSKLEVKLYDGKK